MADYIKRDDILDMIIIGKLEYPECGSAFDGMETEVRHLPSADVAKVIRGSWNNKGNFENLNPTNFEMYECSACGEWLSVGEVSFDYFEKHYNFCPNCGARMGKK